jgi:hypothetical protein
MCTASPALSAMLITDMTGKRSMPTANANSRSVPMTNSGMDRQMSVIPETRVSMIPSLNTALSDPRIIAMGMYSMNAYRASSSVFFSFGMTTSDTLYSLTSESPKSPCAMPIIHSP